jgi:GTP1/Obg family GTP-binding protein
LNEISREAVMRLDRRFFGNHQTVEQFNKEQEQWKQARADMEAGVSSAESEAAEYIRQLFKRYPRKQGVKRFYHIWE